MAAWNELFLDGRNVAIMPQPEVYKFIKLVEAKFPERPLTIWDFCCGAGRHTALAARMGHRVYGSDISENGINMTGKLLDYGGNQATLKTADMTENIFDDVSFHGVFSWDAIHHNTLGNIEKAVDIIYNRLYPGGLFMASLISVKSGTAFKGTDIEKNTYVEITGDEAGVPHHYFDEDGIRDLFGKWKIRMLAEVVVTYVEENLDHRYNPFPYTKWNVIVEKP